MDKSKNVWLYVHDRKHPRTGGTERKGLVMRELHIKISELIAAGVNVYDPEETLRVATARGYQLVVRVIEHDPKRFLSMVAAWFEQEVVA